MHKDRYAGRHYFRFIHHDNATGFGLSVSDLLTACRDEKKGATRRIQRWLDNFGHQYISRDNDGRISLDFRYNTQGMAGVHFVTGEKAEPGYITHFDRAIRDNRWSDLETMEISTLTQALFVFEKFPAFVDETVRSNHRGPSLESVNLPKIEIEIHEERIPGKAFVRLPRLYLVLPDNWLEGTYLEKMVCLTAIYELVFEYRCGVGEWSPIGLEDSSRQNSAWREATLMLEKDAEERKQAKASEKANEKKKKSNRY